MYIWLAIRIGTVIEQKSQTTGDKDLLCWWSHSIAVIPVLGGFLFCTKSERKQKLEQARVNEELGRMLTERFPNITPDTFDEFIPAKVIGNEVSSSPC